jgi:hypothetical protein
LGDRFAVRSQGAPGDDGTINWGIFKRHFRGELLRHQHGVAYTYLGEDHQMHQLGTEDRTALRRLERAGKLTYLDDDVRERYQTMKRAGLFG